LAAAAPQIPSAPAAPPMLRAFANEDIYFHVKRIDNSRVMRQTDPASGRAAWSMISSAGVAAALLVAALLPAGYQVLAGYQLEQLRQENERLSAQNAELVLQESKLLTPERMEQLAREQQFADPTLVYLDAPDEGKPVSASNQSNSGEPRLPR
jgi:hypothetical protein